MWTVNAVMDLGWSGKNHETIAIEALRFLAERPGTLRRFLDEVALEADQVRGFAELPSFRVAVLDFIVSDPQSYLAFRRSSRLRHEEIGVVQWHFEHASDWS